MRQGRSSKAYSIKIEIFVIVLSRMRVSLSFLLSASFLSDECVWRADSTSGDIWLTKLRFILSITWRLKCPIKVIDRFLAWGTVEREELCSSCSVRTQFNSMSDHAESWTGYASDTYVPSVSRQGGPRMGWEIKPSAFNQEVAVETEKGVWVPWVCCTTRGWNCTKPPRRGQSHQLESNTM